MTPLEHIMGLMDPSYPEPVRRSMAQGILDKHAHELADHIREDTTVMGEAGDQYALLYADLIDPETQRATTRKEQP